MEDITKELNEKLKDVCESIDVDYNEYVVIRKDELDMYIDMGAELGALEEFGVKKWERYDEAMRSVYGDDTPTLPEELMITMTKSEYDKLCEAYDKLQALECYGVDNWEGYEDAMQSLYDEDEY